MTKNTLILLVTCTLEETRMRVLEKVIQNLNEMPDQSFKRDFIVFDNASTYPGSIEIFNKLGNLSRVVQCKRNVGFWNAIKWVMENQVLCFNREYDYLYVIESDILHTQDAFQRLAEAENFLATHDNVGFVRTEEFSVTDRNLYDKRNPKINSKKHAWVVQDNFITKKRVEFFLADEKNRIYTCNFLAKVPVLSRMTAMQKVFNELAKLETFNEMDYQRFYHDLYEESAVLDGGIWNSQLGNDPRVILTGSWNSHLHTGYKETRTSKIEHVNSENDIVILR